VDVEFPSAATSQFCELTTVENLPTFENLHMQWRQQGGLTGWSSLPLPYYYYLKKIYLSSFNCQYYIKQDFNVIHVLPEWIHFWKIIVFAYQFSYIICNFSVKGPMNYSYERPCIKLSSLSYTVGIHIL